MTQVPFESQALMNAIAELRRENEELRKLARDYRRRWLTNVEVTNGLLWRVYAYESKVGKK